MNIISLSFFNDIWIHSYPEFIFYKNLKKKYNVNIDNVNCKKVFSDICPAHNNKSILITDSLKTKDKICNSCIKTTNFYKKNSNINHIYLNDNILEQDKLEIDKIIRKVNIKNFHNLRVFDVDVSKVTFFNFIINNKLGSVNLSQKHFEDFKVYLKNALQSLYGFKRIISKKKYKYLIAYGTEYSLYKVCADYAKKKGIKIMNFVAGKNPSDKYKKIFFAESYKAGFVYYANMHWSKFKKKPILKSDLANVKNYLESMIQSKSYLNFSLPPEGKNIRKYFKIENKYKKVVLVALSGTGERLGDHLSGFRQSKTKNCSSVHFKNDYDWVKFLIPNIKKFKDTFFIFRVHPRDYDTHGNVNESSIIEKYRKLSKILPNNTKFDFKEDQISIYDYIPYINLLLNSSSVTSYEFGLFGIRTLVFDPNLHYYSNDLVIYPKNFKNYISLLKKTLDNENYDKKKIIVNSFKYLSLQFNYESIDISDIFNVNSSDYLIKILNRLQRYIGYNFMINYLYSFKNTNMKNINLFYRMLKNNHNSLMEITLKKKVKNKSIKKQFVDVKKMILNQLKINNKKKIYEKIERIN